MVKDSVHRCLIRHRPHGAVVDTNADAHQVRVQRYYVSFQSFHQISGGIAADCRIETFDGSSGVFRLQAWVDVAITATNHGTSFHGLSFSLLFRYVPRNPGRRNGGWGTAPVGVGRGPHLQH